MTFRFAHHSERRFTGNTGWLRASVLGANDGLLSTASLVLGVAAAQGTRNAILVACVAGLVAGAMSMAAGEYVSVHSQADAEQADLDREHQELRANDVTTIGWTHLSFIMDILSDGENPESAPNAPAGSKFAPGRRKYDSASRRRPRSMRRVIAPTVQPQIPAASA